jgi:predicted kinase
MATLYLIRGLPGVGKSTLAKKLSLPSGIVEADQWFMKDGVYQFDGSQAFLAHAWCQETTRQRLAKDLDTVVCNTFVTHAYLQPYLDMARMLDAYVVVVTVDNRWTDEELAARSVHDVPIGTIQAMRESWEA